MVKFRRATVLLAEDNPDEVEIARRALKRSQLNCELLVARDGEEALRMLGELQHSLPDLMLLDLNLPKVSGLQVLGQLRANPCFAGLPVVVMSASVREEDVTTSYELGANTYIQKPVLFDRFVEVLDILGRYWFEVARLPRAV